MPESLTSSTAFHPAFNAEAKPATSARDMKSAGAKMYDCRTKVFIYFKQQ
jgi:hypothetical protein